MDHHLVNDIAICIIAAWVLALGAHIFKQPLILAYLLTGFALGPLGLQLVSSQQSVQTMSDLGLILLLFMIGLDIDLKKMLGSGKAITTASGTQILGGCLVCLAAFWVLGVPLGAGRIDALYLAVAATLSSTVIVVKILYDKRELDTLAGRVTLGVLVLQDLFAILFLAVQPNLSNPAVAPLALALVKVLVLMAVAFTIARYVLPTLFRIVARLPELVLVGALAWCFLIAGLAGYFGLSKEMGALTAGVAISTFPYTLDVVAKVTTLRDFFVTLFFVALGMSIPALTGYLAKWAVLFTLVMAASRVVTVFLPLYLLKLGHRISILPTINLSQVSELSLVILALGQASGHIQAETIGIVAYAFAIAAAGSTYAMTKSESILKWLSPKLSLIGIKDLEKQPEAEANSGLKPSIYVLGFSWTASSLLEEISRKDPAVLKELCILDFNPNVNQELRKRGVRVIYGDISQSDTLEHAGLGEAKVIIATLSNTVLKGTNNLRLVRQIREINREATVVMHAELFSDVPKLYEAGASYVSVPRLIEAMSLFDVIEASRHGQLEAKREELNKELANRQEVIP